MDNEKKVEFNDKLLITNVKVKKYIEFDEMNEIIKNIIDSCIFYDKKSIMSINYPTVEIIKRYLVAYNFTDIDLIDIKKNKEEDNTDFIEKFCTWSHKNWDKLKAKIKNYDLFEEFLYKTISDKLRQSQIDYKVSELIDVLMNTIKDVDISKIEGIISNLNLKG